MGSAKSRSAHVIIARMITATARTIPKINAAGFDFGATVPLLVPDRFLAMPEFGGAKRERCVRYFTLRWDIIPHLRPGLTVAVCGWWRCCPDPSGLGATSVEPRQQPLRFALRQPASDHRLGRPHVFGHIPSSLSFEHRRLRRKAHLQSRPSRGRFCYCYQSVELRSANASAYDDLKSNIQVL